MCEFFAACVHHHMWIVSKEGFLELELQMVVSHPEAAENQRATSEHLSRPCFFVFVLSAEYLVVWIYCNLFADPVKAV